MSGNRKHAITMSILYNCFQLFMFFSTSSLHEGIISSGLLLAAKEIESARSVVKLLPASARFVFHTRWRSAYFLKLKIYNLTSACKRYRYLQSRIPSFVQFKPSRRAVARVPPDMPLFCVPCHAQLLIT